MLTGESLPVRKNEDEVFEDNTGPGDRINVAYSSSTVTKGRAKGIVFATATSTEIGAIAAALRKKDSKPTLSPSPTLLAVSSASTSAHLSRRSSPVWQSTSSALPSSVPLSSLLPTTSMLPSRLSSTPLLLVCP
ncbi:hypothetical protein LB505_009247 [Fusarium chuoi]|nr:hypothetical protein LB505_009247 [Fusarium chuoi]